MMGPALFAILISLTILLLFVAVWRLAPRQDPVTERLDDYGAASQSMDGSQATGAGSTRLHSLQHTITKYGFGQKLARMLTQGDIPLTAAEFSLIVLGVGLLGMALGTLRSNLLVGLGLALVLGLIPIAYVRRAISRRRRALTDQLPDTLTMLVGGLKAGYGLSQAIEVVSDELPPPTSTEFRRVLRAMHLGVPLPTALGDMANRVQSDDLDLVVTAITVQSELGGNLAQVLDTIGETIRERIRILREVRVLTAQQRLTGYILALLPVGLAIGLALLSPGYFEPFFEPGPSRLIPIAAVVMMVVGFILIGRIVDIEV